MFDGYGAANGCRYLVIMLAIGAVALACLAIIGSAMVR